MLSKMLGSILPPVEPSRAKATTASDEVNCNLPTIHRFGHLTSMHQAKMLLQMIFPIKSSRRQAFFFTIIMIMRVQVVLCWIHVSTINTLFRAGYGRSNDWPKRCANPFLKADMHRLLVSSPVMLGLEAIGAEGAFEKSFFLVSIVTRSS